MLKSRMSVFLAYAIEKAQRDGNQRMLEYMICMVPNCDWFYWIMLRLAGYKKGLNKFLYLEFPQYFEKFITKYINNNQPEREEDRAILEGVLTRFMSYATRQYFSSFANMVIHHFDRRYSSMFFGWYRPQLTGVRTRSSVAFERN